MYDERGEKRLSMTVSRGDVGGPEMSLFSAGGERVFHFGQLGEQATSLQFADQSTQAFLQAGVFAGVGKPYIELAGKGGAIYYRSPDTPAR